MSIRDKLLDFKDRLTDRHMYSIVLVVIAVIAGFGIYEYKRSIDFRGQVENGYQRAFTDLVDYVNGIDTTLTKAMVSTSPNQLATLSADLWRQAAFAKANLGQLPISNTELDKTANFLSQVGDYTYSLSKKFANNQPLTEKETSQLNDLSKYATTLSASLQDMESQMYAGTIRFGDISNQGKKYFGDQKTSIGDGLQEVEKGFSNYASLIYDGPFSQHIQDKEPLLTKNAPAITADDAKQRVMNFLGVDKVQSVELTGESEGRIPTFDCKAITADKNREITVSVTKNGGYILLVLDNKSPDTETMDVNAAALKAREFLQTHGFTSMKESYYQRDGNTVTINYAYSQDKFTMYTDLIKVKISLDDGEMIGFEANGYITNHIANRPLPTIKITEAEARSKVKKELTIKNVNYALIPLETGQEVYCYELRGTYNDKNFLIYVNVENGKEEKILLLLENEDGTLTI